MPSKLFKSAIVEQIKRGELKPIGVRTYKPVQTMKLYTFKEFEGVTYIIGVLHYAGEEYPFQRKINIHHITGEPFFRYGMDMCYLKDYIDDYKGSH